MITTTHKTSKALWDAGVRIETELYWFDPDLPFDPYITTSNGSNKTPAPTFTELVEWLKGKWYALEMLVHYGEVIIYLEEKESLVKMIKNVTNLTEAAAECCMEVMRREGKK